MKLFMMLLLSMQLYSNNTFEVWQTAEREAFESFESKGKKGFSEFLKEWSWYKEREIPSSYPKPKPYRQPFKHSKPIEKKKLIIKKKKPKTHTPLTLDKPINITNNYNFKNIDFFGLPLNFNYEKKLIPLKEYLSVSQIANFWNNMEQKNYAIVVNRLQTYQLHYHLNDWAIYLLIKKLTQKMSYNQNTQKLLHWFFLLKMGLDAKIGIARNHLLLMVHTKTLVYSCNSFFLNNRRYFVLDRDLSVQNIKIYKSENRGKHGLNFIAQVPLLKQNLQEKILDFNFKNKRYKISLYYNQNLINFYATYPQIPHNYPAKMPLSRESQQSIENLKSIIDTMSKIDAINFLLRLTQNSFRYQSDQEQFRKEKGMFFEETLAYPYSDCDDRAIFFTQLIKKLLGLDIVLILYPNHLATAIALNQSIQGENFYYNNKKYYIADPTYSNANIGQAMPPLRGHKFKILIP